MSRPVFEAKERGAAIRGFQSHPRRQAAAVQAHAFATFAMASALTLATIVMLTIVSIEVVKAAPLF